MATTPDPGFYETPRGERSLERLKTVQPTDAVTAARARVPAFVDVRKTEYLVLRSVHFTQEQALKMIGVEQAAFEYWVNSDEDFKDWAVGKSFYELNHKVGEEILRSRFMQNVFLQLNIDQSLLWKRMSDPEGMTELERKEAFESSKRYSAPNIATMLKLLEPEHKDDDRPATVIMQINVDGQAVVTYEGKRAAARDLLNQWTQSQEDIEGEYEVIENDLS